MIYWMLMVGMIFPRASQGTQFSSSCVLISWTFVSTSQLPQEATDSEEEADTNDSDDEDDSAWQYHEETWVQLFCKVNTRKQNFNLHTGYT